MCNTKDDYVWISYCLGISVHIDNKLIYEEYGKALDSQEYIKNACKATSQYFSDKAKLKGE